MSLAHVNLRTALTWMEEGRRIAIATLVETEGSSPLDPGAMMLIDDNDNIEGSVTGGCVESALVEEAREVLAGGQPRVKTYGISDPAAADVGLTCGGTVHIFVEALDEGPRQVLYESLGAALGGRPVAVAMRLDDPDAGARLAIIGGDVRGSLGLDFLDRTVERETKGMLAQGVDGLRHYGADGAAMGSDVRVAVKTYTEPPRMIIFGAIDFSAATAALARQLGYRVAIVDPREPFIRSQRFEDVADVAVDIQRKEVVVRGDILDEAALRAAIIEAVYEAAA